MADLWFPLSVTCGRSVVSSVSNLWQICGFLSVTCGRSVVSSVSNLWQIRGFLQCTLVSSNFEPPMNSPTMNPLSTLQLWTTHHQLSNHESKNPPQLYNYAKYVLIIIYICLYLMHICTEVFNDFLLLFILLANINHIYEVFDNHDIFVWCEICNLYLW